MKLKFFAIFLFIPLSHFSQLSKTLQECEKDFLKNNLQLLVEQYNISAADADIVQAKIWDLPQFSYQANLLSPHDRTFFNIGPSQSVTLQQLFLLGKKRKLETAFAKSNKELAQLQFRQLLVELKTELRQAFYTLYFEQRKLKNIDNQLGYMNELLKAYRVQTAKGNISLKDQVRLSAIVMNLNNDKIEINNGIASINQKLMTLTGNTEIILPEITDSEAEKMLNEAPLDNLDDLQKKALENNADYLYGLKIIDANTANYKYQKSLNIPDLTGLLQWDTNSGVYTNEINIGISIPIQLWKRNAGNVQKAQIQIEQAQKSSDFKKQQLTNAVTSAYQTWENQYNLYKNIPQKDMTDLETVYKGMTENFRRGNVTLLEFADFMDSYKQTTLQLFEIQKQIMLSAEELNRLTQTKNF